jgi:hypothetical protein
MIKIVDTSKADDISAFLTTTFISHTYEVESTQAIVNLWDNIRKNVNLKEDLDYISAMLASGRVRDYRFEIDNMNFLQTIINDINTNIQSRKIESVDLQKELLFAHLTAASISRSEKVENIREIVDLWMQIKEGIEINDDLDLIAAILTTGRILELKIKAGGIEFINTIFMNLKKELAPQIAGKKISQKEISAAFLTSAYIEISKKVEKIRDIVEAWDNIRKNLKIKDDWDYIASILSSGKIKDMDAMHIEGHEGIKNIKKKIRTQIKEVVGE